MTTKQRRQQLTRDMIQMVNEQSAFINVALGSMIDIADSQITECTQQLKNEGLYRHTVKYLTGNVRNERIKLQSAFLENVADRKQEYMALLDAITDDVRTDTDKLYYPIKNLLDRHREERSALKARIVMIHIIIHIACRTFQGICRRLEERTPFNMTSVLIAINPLPMKMAWNKVLCEVCRFKTDMMHEIYNDKTIALASGIIARKLTDMKRMDENCKKAV